MTESGAAHDEHETKTIPKVNLTFVLSRKRTFEKEDAKGGKQELREDKVRQE